MKPTSTSAERPRPLKHAGVASSAEVVAGFDFNPQCRVAKGGAG
jgi:hypothetical protein